MENKVERFQESSYFTLLLLLLSILWDSSLALPDNGVQEGTYRSDKPITATNDTNNFALNLCPDGSNICINGTTVDATETLLKAIIGGFTISISSNSIKVDDLMPSIRSLISVTQGTPLHVISGDSLNVSATLPFTEVHSDDLVNLSSNGQGAFFLSANSNTYYVAVGSDNSIQVLSESEIAATTNNIYTFTQEVVNGVVGQERYYTEANGDRYYLMVTSEGEVTTLHADDLIVGSVDDFRSRFRQIIS